MLIDTFNSRSRKCFHAMVLMESHRSQHLNLHGLAIRQSISVPHTRWSIGLGFILLFCTSFSMHACSRCVDMLLNASMRIVYNRFLYSLYALVERAGEKRCALQHVQRQRLL